MHDTYLMHLQREINAGRITRVCHYTLQHAIDEVSPRPEGLSADIEALAYAIQGRRPPLRGAQEWLEAFGFLRYIDQRTGDYVVGPYTEASE